MTITQAMAARRTIQIRYSRFTELCDVVIVRGRLVEEPLAGNLSEGTAELVADVCAGSYRLDVSRIDVP